MRDHVLIITSGGEWCVVGRVNCEPHPKLLCQRIERAAAAFMAGLQPRRWWNRYRGPVGNFWVGLDEGNLHIGARLSPVEVLLETGML